MKVAITDANIFIDLVYIELCDKLFALDLEIHTTFEVYHELNHMQKEILDEYVGNGKLALHSREESRPVNEIQSRKNLSESDKSVMYLAIHLNAILLTGDNVLRKTSGIMKIEVHGIFWLLDKFLSNKLLTKKHASKQLKFLMDYNKRLPIDECEKRLGEWSK